MVSLSTNAWSLIIFMLHIVSLFTILMIFSKPSITTAITLGSSWLISQLVVIYYGYITDQLGFLLLGIFNIIIGLIGAVLKIGDEDED